MKDVNNRFDRFKGRLGNLNPYVNALNEYFSHVLRGQPGYVVVGSQYDLENTSQNG